jgi:hypothetical protein
MASAVVIMAYAYVDLRLHPWLAQETNFSMTPDLSQLPDLLHWGGRLLKENALMLLLGNALVLGGLVALAVTSLARLWHRKREFALSGERISVLPSQPTSVPPPH